MNDSASRQKLFTIYDLLLFTIYDDLPPLRFRVRFVVNLNQFFHRNVRVDLGG